MQQNPILDDDTHGDELAPGVTLLHGQYLIEENLVRGGFGITYLARDSLDREVVIKECFPGAICCRAGGVVQARAAERASQFGSIKRHFLREARRLARLDHPNIVGVHQVFEENNTAYMVLDYVDGVDLLTVLEDEPERLSPGMIRALLDTALESLSYIHGLGILHRDISPDNFLLDQNGTLTLIDFGAAREQAGKENRALSALLAVKDGYSPHEFYLADVAQSPSSDIYSLGATFYHLVTGEAPPDSQQRLAAIAAHQPDPYQPLAGGNWGYDRAFLASIDRALAVLQKDRIQTAEEWMDLLRSMPAPEPEPEPAGDLNRVISRLVEDTNKSLEPGKPAIRDTRPRRAPSRRLRRVTEAEKPAVPVDIFGNPIEDVEAWQREQDRLSKLKQAAAKVQPKTQDEPQETAGGRRSIAMMLLERLTARRVSGSYVH